MHRSLLHRAHEIASRYLDDVATRPVGGTATRASLVESLGGPLPQEPTDPLIVLEQLAEGADPGIVASAGPRYFGFVTGGALPVTVAAEWLGTALDQNACLYVSSPAISKRRYEAEAGSSSGTSMMSMPAHEAGVDPGSGDPNVVFADELL